MRTARGGGRRGAQTATRPSRDGDIGSVGAGAVSENTARGMIIANATVARSAKTTTGATADQSATMTIGATATATAIAIATVTETETEIVTAAMTEESASASASGRSASAKAIRLSVSARRLLGETNTTSVERPTGRAVRAM